MNVTKHFILLISLILSLSIVYAASPLPFQVSDNPMQIEYTKYDAIKLGDDHRFHVHVINETGIITNTTATCYFHLYNQTGWDVSLNQLMEFETYNGIDFAYSVNGRNFTLGQWSYVITCNSSKQAAFISAPIEVTKTGNTTIEPGESLLILTGVLLLILIAIYFLVLGIKSEKSMKIISLVTSGIFIVIAVLYTLVSMEQALSHFNVIVEGYTTFWSVLKVLVGIVILSLTILIGVLSLRFWFNKRGFRD